MKFPSHIKVGILVIQLIQTHNTPNAALVHPNTFGDIISQTYIPPSFLIEPELPALPLWVTSEVAPGAIELSHITWIEGYLQPMYQYDNREVN